MCRAWTRIWCVLPVRSLHSTTDAPPPASTSTTRNSETAGLPLLPWKGKASILVLSLVPRSMLVSTTPRGTFGTPTHNET